MNEHCQKLIITNFLKLMEECNVEAIKPILIKQNVFTENEMKKIDSTDNARHNKRMFFFNLIKKDQNFFQTFINSLKITNQYDILKIFAPQNKSGCEGFGKPNYSEPKIEESLDLPIRNLSNRTTPLEIKVTHSSRFLDVKKSSNDPLYKSRSKKRGRILIINNYEYKEHKSYREGAKTDTKNLKELFTEMGGWSIEDHENKTAEEMRIVIRSFAQNKDGRDYDICMIIIMAHGDEITNDTIIFGIDNKYVYEKEIIEEFTNRNSKSLHGKPKILLFQVCRGDEADEALLSSQTQTDSQRREKRDVEPPTTSVVRTYDDMLLGYATIQGFKAHRDIYRGTWYIESLCENFMNHAHEQSVYELLNLVDHDLRHTASEYRTMQTSEQRHLGFKKLFLNPGIYSENEELKKFITNI